MNSLLISDAYKQSHKAQYPKGTNLVYSNWTPRSDVHAKTKNGVVVFGIQAFLKKLNKWFDDNFFSKPKSAVILEFKEDYTEYFGVEPDTEHVGQLHDLGYLPIIVKALPEGSICSIGVPMLTIYNSIPDFYWVTNFLETIISTELWLPMTSATIAKEYRTILDKWADKTCDNREHVPFQAHDFSMRGMSGLEAAMASGAGHLLSFVGSDTIPSVYYLKNYYKTDSKDGIIATSIPATEHSVMSMGTKEDELGTFKRLITETYPNGIVSIVSDTWDLWKVCTKYISTLKNEILSRDGKVVIRPDSGDPVDIICGSKKTVKEYSLKKCPTKKIFLKFAEDDMHDTLCGETPHGEYGGDCTKDYIWNGRIYTLNYDPDWNRYDKQYYFIDNYGDKTPSIINEKQLEINPSDVGVIELLWNVFGGTINNKGYKELDPHIGAIYGDSITLERAEEICIRLAEKGFASSNIVFGVGSFTYQFNTRDTYGFAMKATYGEVNEAGRNIFKDPVTDDGIKKSAKGLLKVYRLRGAHGYSKYLLKDQCTWEEESEGDLSKVYENGKLLNETTLTQIRKVLNG